jgi:hypothetical protein
MSSQTAENPKGKTPKVAKSSIVADEVVVTKLSKRVPMKIVTSEGLHKMSSNIVKQLNLN